MPLNKYFSGHGDKVMANMKKEYGEEKGEKVFYATAHKKGMGNVPMTRDKKKSKKKTMFSKGK